MTSPEIRGRLDETDLDEGDESMDNLLSAVGSVKDLAAWVNSEVSGKGMFWKAYIP